MLAQIKAKLSKVKKAFEPMQDDMSSTIYHIEQIERKRCEFADIDSEIVRSATVYNGELIATKEAAFDYMEAR